MRWARRALCALAALFWALLCARRAAAAGDPELDYWTIETAHFRIHYEKNLEPVAERVARLSEAIHARLIGPLGYKPSEHTEVLLTDQTDDANGSATALPYNQVRLFVTAPADLSPLGDYDDWYLSLMTHEYTHILHVDNISGIPSVVNAILGKTLAPNQLQPRWFIEGLAVVAESAFTSGGRIRASLFDMFMRADVLDEEFARLDQISSNPIRWPYGTLWYLYGSYFLQWIAEVYGADVLRAVAADYGASLVPWGINRAIRRQTGRTYTELYDGFRDHLERRYARQMQAVRARGLREGKRITHDGRHLYYPHFAPRAQAGGRHQIVYFKNDMHERQGIYRRDLSGNDETLIARVNEPGSVSFAPDGSLFFSSVVPYRRIYSRTDLFSLPPGETAPEGNERKRRRLTEGLRATAPAVSADGRTIAFTVNNRGTTTLQEADIDPEGALRNRRVLVKGRPFDQVFTPVYSPDGAHLAYSHWTAGGFRDVYIRHLETRRTIKVTNDRAIDMGPAWSPDGKKLYFSSDRTGIYNIYEYDLASRELAQVTNVQSGALMPAVSHDGRLLAYVGYSSKGFDLYAMRLDPSRYLRALPAPADRPDPPPEPPAVAMKKHRYNPWPTLRPHSWFIDFAPGLFGDNALTVTVATSDIVGHHSFAGSITADPEVSVPMFTFDYVYGRLPVDMGLRLSNRVTPRTDFRFNDQELTYRENSYSVQTSLSYAHPQEFGVQRFSLSHNLAVLDAELPFASAGRLDPWAQPTVEPLRGLISFVHLGYSFSNAETSIDTAGGAVRGYSLNLGFDVGDETTGSEESIYAGTYSAVGYFPTPWRGSHVLAIRSSGGLSAGTFARRGLFFVGGFNLEEYDFLDTLTTGVFNGAFALRGYPPGSFSGRAYTLENFEYRFPIADIDAGPSTVPVYLRRVTGNLFLDWGGAFNAIDFDQVEFFSNGAIIDSPQFFTGAGAELWLLLTLGYGVDTQVRLGYAYGFGAPRVPHGQFYFIVSSAF